MSCPGLQICSWPARRQSDPTNASPPQLHIVYRNIVCISSSYMTPVAIFNREPGSNIVPSLYTLKGVWQGQDRDKCKNAKLSPFIPPHSLTMYISSLLINPRRTCTVRRGFALQCFFILLVIKILRCTV